MEANHDEDSQMELKGNVVRPPWKEPMSIEPAAKRQCIGDNLDTTALNRMPDLNDLTDMNNRPLPIPQPETTVHHDYGHGHNQMNITHCGTMGQQNVGLGGLPRVYVQPTHPDANINYRQIDDQLVSNLLKNYTVYLKFDII